MTKIYLTLIIKNKDFDDRYDKYYDEIFVKIFYYSNLKMIDYYHKTINIANNELFTIVFEKEIEDELNDKKRILVVKTFDPLFVFPKNVRSLGSFVSLEKRKQINYISRTISTIEPIYFTSCYEDDSTGSVNDYSSDSDNINIRKIDRKRRIYRKKKNEEQLCINIKFKKEVNNEYKDFLKKYDIKEYDDEFSIIKEDGDYYIFKHTFLNNN